MQNYDNKITRLLDIQERETITDRGSHTTVRKKNARIVCHDNNEYWTTQKQFWQWVREGVVKKRSDNPLTGRFVDRDEEKNVILSNAILNLRRPNHLREVLFQKRLRKRNR